ncbi:MAG TPA: twin-arginine translocation signal domain-containing protein [Gemmatimonadaceae bacterium]|nr:twin-arginine translocation signal domain-containing protein [Gemmatimonadaceae bacterium]
MSSITTLPVGRRGFLARLSAAGAAALLGAPTLLRAMPGKPIATTPDDPDAWIARLTGRDRTLLHSSERLLVALAGAHGILRDATHDYRVPERENSVAIAAHGPAIGGLFTDETWRRFALAERYAAGTGTTENPFLRPQPDTPPEVTVPGLVARGVVFVVCNVAVRNLARRVAGDPERVDQVHRELTAGVVPGVAVVPNVFVAIAHAQQRGVSYIHLD